MRWALHRVVAVTLGLVLALAIGEGTIRVFSKLGGESGRRLAARDPLAVVYEPYGNFGYRPTAGKVEKYANGTRAHFNSIGTRGPVVHAPKRAGVYRIVLLGGSTMAGYGVNDDETIDAYMRQLLPERFPGRCFEVVNLALGGYDSYQDYERMRVDGVPLTPDLVVLHSGINDVRNARYPTLTAPPDRRTLIWATQLSQFTEASGRGRAALALLKHYSFLARLPGYVWELSRQGQELHVIQEVGPYDAAAIYFKTNVERTVKLAVGSDAAILLSTPPSALSTRNRPSDPVEKSYWIRDAGTTEAYRERLAALLREVADSAGRNGVRIAYVAHALPLAQYLDDAHLTPQGNQAVARNLVSAATGFIDAWASSAAPSPLSCQ